MMKRWLNTRKWRSLQLEMLGYKSSKHPYVTQSNIAGCLQPSRVIMMKRWLNLQDSGEVTDIEVLGYKSSKHPYVTQGSIAALFKTSRVTMMKRWLNISK